MRYKSVINQIANHLEHEPSKIKRQQLRDIACELRYESRYEPMATENYYLTMINYAQRIMGLGA